MSLTPSVLQEAFIQWMKDNLGNGRHLGGEAVAGSGKSSTLVMMFNELSPNVDAMYCAFNRDIVLAMKPKMPEWARAKTYNALGSAAVVRSFPKTQFDEEKIDKFIRNSINKERQWITPSTKRLISLCKGHLLTSEQATDKRLYGFAFDYDVDLYDDKNDDAKYLIFDMVRKALSHSFDNTDVHDYDDQIWLPGVHPNCIPHQYDFLAVDECLPYKTPIHLEDGSWMNIGDIVENKSSVNVLSYDVFSGEQKSCKVIGWQKLVNQKPMVKVKVKWSRRVGTNYPYSFVTCTTDHKIWTSEGYIEAGKLVPGMIVQVETSAYKSENYKITTKGRKSLTNETNKRNSAGFERGKSPTRESFMKIRGGNGKGLTETQLILLNSLGDGWIPEYVQKTSDAGGLKNGYPNNYKIDLANPDKMIAIEIDGQSHRNRKSQDIKKDTCLSFLGWKVYRISTNDVYHNLDNIVSSILVDCPIDATVISVEEAHTKEKYVYDITVEDCHNFYANSILVHNCQDTNMAKMYLAINSVHENGNIVFIGDSRQAIYGYTGANRNAMSLIQETLKADMLPLSISYRCPTKVRDLVNQKFPDIQFQSPDWAIEGEINTVFPEKAEDMVKPNDMVLCRVNADLIPFCFGLLRKNIKATIKGRDIGKSIASLIKKQKCSGTELDVLFAKLDAWEQKEIQKARMLNHDGKVSEIQDKVATIHAIAEDADTVEQLIERCSELFSDERSSVTLSSIHKSKGLEADNVFILRPDLLPHPAAKKPEQAFQEGCVEYVAITRAKKSLTYVS